MVPIVQAVRSLRMAQRGDDALGSAVVLRRMWRADRARRERRTEFGTLAGFELPGDRAWRPCKSGYAGSGRLVGAPFLIDDGDDWHGPVPVCTKVQDA